MKCIMLRLKIIILFNGKINHAEGALVAFQHLCMLQNSQCNLHSTFLIWVAIFFIQFMILKSELNGN